MVSDNVLKKDKREVESWRLTSETILPQNKNNTAHQPGYDIYPCHSLIEGTIFSGYDSLAKWITEQKTVVIDGYVGVFWDEVRDALDKEFSRSNILVGWTVMADRMKESSAIEELVKPFLGSSGSTWGKKCDLKIEDFFQPNEPDNLAAGKGYDVNITIGIGSATFAPHLPIIYLDVPKNEIHYRMRAGTAMNFGSDKPGNPAEMYKRCYFVDWVVLNEYKKKLLPKITIIADAQWKDTLKWTFKTHLLQSLKALSGSVFRVRPWFAAGPWGGHWMQERFDQLNKDEVNYAWSFELIAPENGLVFENAGNLLEISFDFLMFTESEGILGKHSKIFNDEFPIRFNFLDTFDGGNLSIQCHPSLPYIQKVFGEHLTQDETYYILDCKEGAVVYLGFQDDIEPAEFKQALVESQALGKEVEITKYIQDYPTKKHDLFLIPNGTVHSAGTHNMVLEISATPYIFTFKMYDWMRPGLDGKPRPINIDHAFSNLNFERKGEMVAQELISKSCVIDQGTDWELIHLPTHSEHFYDIHRLEFHSSIIVHTHNVCHVLMLVEGTTISVETSDGSSASFQYAETFVIPAAANSYQILNTGKGKAKVIKAFVKDEIYLADHLNLA